MRKIVLLSMLFTFILACSMSDLEQIVATPTIAQVADTASPYPTWTFTPLVPPTFTLTPTLIGQKPSPTITSSPTLAPTSDGNTPTAVNTVPGPAVSPTLLAGNTGFDMILLSGSQLYIGSCGPEEVEFEVLVSKPSKVQNVLIFFKLRNKNTKEESSWSRGSVFDYKGEGKYSYTLESSRYINVKDPNWILYQLVATDDEQTIVARSEVFPTSLSLVKCP